jgi:hypothetical protein
METTAKPSRSWKAHPYLADRPLDVWHEDLAGVVPGYPRSDATYRKVMHLPPRAPAGVAPTGATKAPGGAAQALSPLARAILEGFRDGAKQ